MYFRRRGSGVMLCQFTVKNFQCIKDEVTLDMQATNISEHQDTILTDSDGESFLPLAVIYGPNGGGKTTVLKALYALACKIMRPICAVSCDNEDCIKSSEHISIEPYAFSKDTIKAPTEFELFFRTKTYEYQYQVSIRKDKIVSESLHRKALAETSRYTLVFERTGNKNIMLRGSFRNYNVSDVSDTLTLISYFGITHRRNSIIKDIVNWFDNGIDFINYGNPKEDAQIAIVDKASDKTLVLKMLAEMDIDVSDYRIEKEEDRLRLFTTHQINSEKYELPFSAESNGTIKVFGLLPYIANSITEGSTLVIDELDAKLHPLLLKYIIQLFNNPQINTRKSQLIFTSHDLTTMNSENFRRDEIWFIAKGTDQTAHMYSLVEIKERKEASFNKHYLEGQYGADPYLKRIIDWRNV